MNRLLLFTAAFLFSTGGAGIKFCSLTSWQVASFRSGIAALVMSLLLPEARRHWTRWTVLSGIAYAATLVSFVLANKLTTSANAIYLQSTAPLYMLVLGPLVLHEAIRRVDLVLMSLVAVGALLLFSGGGTVAGATAPDPFRGNIFGAISGVSWALTLTSLRWLGKHHPSGEAAASTVIVGNLIAFGACLPFAFPVDHIGIADVASIGYLGVFQVGLAYLALTRSIRHVPGLEAATLLLAEPVFNPLWTWLLHGERPGPSALAGGALIISAGFLGSWWQARRPTVSEPA